jgi:predicted RNA-binding protein with PIN domain
VTCDMYSIAMPYWFDGNNLIGQSAAVSRKDRDTRKAFLSKLSAHQKSGGGRFLVYFDGDDPADSSPPPGVNVRYSAPESADIAMLRRLKDIQRPSEVIVVTNDIELATRFRHAGASSLSWQQFASKMKVRPAIPSHVLNSPQEQVDVEDWMRYFGIDKIDN